MRNFTRAAGFTSVIRLATAKAGRVIVLSMLLSMMGYSGFATNYYYRGGAFNTATNWNSLPGGGGTTPVGGLFTNAGDVFIVGPAFALTINAAWTVVNLQIGDAVAGAGTCTITTNPTVTNGILVFAGSTLNQNVASTAVLPNMQAVQNATGTIVFGGAVAHAMPAITYGNVTVSSTGATKFTAGTTTIAGNFSQTAGTVTVATTNAAYIVNVTGTFGITGSGALVMSSIAGATPTVTVSGAFTMNTTGTPGIQFQSAGAATGTSVFQVNNNATFTAAGGNYVDWGSMTTATNNNMFGVTGNLSFVSNASTLYTTGSSESIGFVFNGAGTAAAPQTFNNASPSSYSSFLVSGGTYVKLTSNTALGIGAGNPSSSFTVNNLGTLDCATFVISGGSASATGGFVLNSGGTLVTANATGVNGSITSTNSSAAPFSPGANYVFNSAVANQTTGNKMPNAFVSPGSVTINNSFGGTGVTLSQNTSFATGSTVNLKTGAFTHGAITITMNVGSNIVRDNGTFATVPIFGGAVNVTYANLGINTLVQTTGVELPVAAATLANLTVNKPGAVITLLGAANPTVNTALTITAGQLSLAANTITLKGTASMSAAANLIGGAASNITTNSAAASLGTLYFDQTTPLTSNNIATFVVNQTLPGTITLGSNMTNSTTMTFTSGKFIIGANTLTLNGTVTGMSAANSFKGSANSNLTIGSAVALGNLFFDQTATPTSNNIATFTMNGTGSATLGNALNISPTLDLYNGTFTNAAFLTMITASTINRDAGTLSAIPTWGAGGTGLINVAYTTGGPNTPAITTGNELPLTATNLNNLTVNKAGAVITLGGSPTVNSAFTLTAGQLSIAANTLTLKGTASTSAGNNIRGGVNSNIAVTATSALGTLFFDQVTAPTSNNINTFTMNGASGSVTLGNALNVSPTLNLYNGTVTNSTFLTMITGSTINRDAGTLSAIPTWGAGGTGLINVNYTTGGPNTAAITTGNELPLTATNLNNLTVNKAGAVITLGGSPTVNSAFTLTAGQLSIAANTLTLKGTASTSAGNNIRGGVNSNISVTTTSALGTLFFDQVTAPTSNNINTFTMNGASGSVTLGNALNISPTLNLYNGTVTNGAFLTMITGSTINRDAGTLSAIPTWGTGGTGLINVAYTTGGPNTPAITTGNELPLTATNLNNLTVNKAGAVITLGGSPTVNSALTLTAGQLSIAANTLTLKGTASTSAGNNLRGGVNSNISVTTTSALGTLFFDQVTAPTSNNINTFTMNGASGSVTLGNALNVSPTLNLYNGTVTNSTFLTMITGSTINRDAGTLSAIPTWGAGGTGQINVNYTTGGPNTATITTGNELPLTTTNLNNLTVNKTGAVISLGGAPTVNGSLTLTSGVLNIGGNDLFLSTGTPAVAPGAFTAANMITAIGAGQVKKMYNANGVYLYPVGDATNYTPITLNVTGTAYTSAYAGVNLKGIKHPNNANTADYLNRYWSVAVSGITGLSYSVTGATYVPGDVVGTEANISAGKYPSALPWVKFGATTVPTHTLSTTAVTDVIADFSGISTLPPSVTTSANTAICVGGSATLTATSPTRDAPFSYVWAPAGSLSASTGTTVVASPAATTTYTLSMTDGNGFKAIGNVTVTVNAVPTVGAITPSDNLLCIGSPLTFTAGAVSGSGSLTSYNWTGPNGFSTTTLVNSAVFTPTVAAASGNYSVTVTYPGNGCTSVASVTAPSVTVNALPTVAGITPSSTIVCLGGPLTLTAGSVTGGSTLTSYNWSGPNSYSATSLANNVAFIPTVTASSGDYSLTVTYTGTGCTSSQVVTVPSVTVNVLPTVASISSSTSYLCVGAPMTFTAGAVSGGSTLSSYNWTGPNSYSTTTLPNTAVLTPTTTAASGDYSLSVTYTGAGCTSAQVVASPTITVNTLPTVGGITSSVNLLCTGSPLTLTGGSVTGTGGLTSYNWSGPNSYISTSLTNSATFTPTTTAASGDYSLTVTYPGSGCTSNASITSPSVTVNAVPTIAGISASSPIVCIGTGLTLTAGAITGGGGSLISYDWTGPNGYSTSSLANNVAFTATTTASGGNYSATVTYQGLGCTSQVAVTSPSVTVNNVPTVTSITAGPTPICVGNILTLTGAGASGTGSLVSYNWTGPNSYSSTSPTSTQTYTIPSTAATGNYSLTVSYPGAGCTSTAVQSNLVFVNPPPNVYNVTGGGGYCTGGTGVHIGLDYSVAGINYQLYNGAAAVGSPQPGSSTGLDFGLQTAVGVYTVTAINPLSSCTAAMNGSATVTINPSPAVYNLSVVGSGSYCSGGSGVDLQLSGSDAGINYQLYRGSLVSGSVVAGGSTPLDMGLQTTAGTYTVLATDAATGCKSNMTGTAGVTVNPTPSIFNVTGGGNYCAGGSGLHVNLSGSTTGVNYQLYFGSTALTPIQAGNGSALDFGAQTATGTYTVLATDATNSCTNNMSGSALINLNPLPTAFAMVGGGGYCIGGTGVHIGLAFSNTGVNYDLYRGATHITTVAGSSSGIDFGLQTVAGIYTVLATNTSTSCTNAMSGTETVTINALPTVHNMTGGGGICSASGGVAVGLDGSETGINYQLYKGTSTVGGTTSGPGGAFSFGLQSSTGTYTVLATDGTTGCSNNMAGSAVVSINPSPAVFNVTGGGNYCAGGGGLHVNLSGSTTGVNYQLYFGSTALTPVLAGNGSALDFGAQTATGTYTVLATDATSSCTNSMSGSALINLNPLPTAFAMIGGGGYCAGGTGVHIGLSFSNTGINYDLYRGATHITTVAGSSSGIDFGLQTVAGTYTVLATNTGTSCTNAMSGSETVTINPLPPVHTVTGGGGICSASGGVAVGLDGSETGINYQLYRGASPVGAATAGPGGLFSFGLQSATGVYTVLATDGTTGCTNNMSGTATVSINPSPAAFNVSGGGNYCAGGVGFHVNLSGSASGVNYQLYNGASAVGSLVAGGSGAIDFGLQTNAGTYTVLATDATTSCTSSMNSSATINVNPVPAIYSVSGGGAYCSGGTGVDISLASSDGGINYQLYRGSSLVGVVPGGSSPLDMGMQTVAGTYTVQATDATSGCKTNMAGSVSVSVNANPAVFSVAGGGGYCIGGSGADVTLSGSATGVNYQLFNGSTGILPVVAGSGTSLDFGLQTATGTYTVLATNATSGCTSNMSGSTLISINPLPTAYAMTGGGAYCSGGPGVHIGLAFSSTGVTYDLYRGATYINTVAGSSSGLDFGAQTVAGVYTVLATNTSTSCTNAMTGSRGVTINALPAVHSVTGGGGYCSGTGGVAVGLSTSETTVNYQLFRGSSLVGSAIPGVNGALSFGAQTTAGTYTVQAADGTTGCTSNMSGSAIVSINATPAAFNVTGGGAYCSGGAGFHVNLSNSVSGINYQLYNGASTVGSAFAGNGSPVDFGLQSGAGTYSVLATDAISSCTNAMNGTATVIVNALPPVYSISSGGNYCAGGSGVDISLGGSNTGINYKLYRNAILVAQLPGSGTILDYGLQTTVGTYSVVANDISTGCVNNMGGTAVVSINPLPAAYTVTGGGNYCVGGAGVHIGLSTGDAGVNYQLYKGATAIGSPVGGSGGGLDFGLVTGIGTYTVAAVNASTSCVNNMTGSVSVSTNPLPAVHGVTGGGSYCAGGTGVDIQLDGSNTGINYQLYNGTTTSGTAMAGTGSALDYGLQTAAGTYTVLATDATTLCTSNMTGLAGVTINALPAVNTVSGSGSYCAGGTGVDITLSNSTVGIHYQLYNGSTPTGSFVTGTGVPVLDMGMQTAAGVYTVLATDPTTLCTNNMAGSASVTINPLPVVYTVNGGGGYCPGGSGVLVGLSNSNTGINYQLYNGSTAVGTVVAGTNSALNFGLQPAGTYTVSAINTTTSCVNNMGGSVIVSINPVPAAQTVTGGGAYCAGGLGEHIGLASSVTGVNYQLYNGATSEGAAVAGTTGIAVDFGLQTAAGVYTVLATDATTSCINAMTGSASVSVNVLPGVYNVTGGGANCAGSAGTDIGLSGSDNSSNISYQLYNGSSTSGAALTGTGASLDFGFKTVSGVYSVLATNTVTACSSNMTGTASITVNPLPAIHSVTGGGPYCFGTGGVHIGLDGSNVGINYQVYQGLAAIGSPVAGTDAVLDLGIETAAGTYTVVATDATTSCSSNMTGSASVTVNPLPLVYTVNGGGSYCLGGSGFDITLSGSNTGINYLLYNGSTVVGSSVPGTNAVLHFGVQSAAGVYTVLATDAGTSCTNNMTGTAVISVNPLPAVHIVTGGGHYCAGGIGVDLGLNTSDNGINYQLYNGAGTVGTIVPGTGSSLDFGQQLASGTYSVLATDATTTCTSVMSVTPTIAIDPLPNVYNVSGGGGYCAGGAGEDVSLSNSDDSIHYQLYIGTTPTGSLLTGVDGVLDMGVQFSAGTYTVLATNMNTSCASNMNGSAAVTINPLPAVQTVTGGGAYCAGGTGVDISLASSVTGINYQLYNGASTSGSALAGNGTTLDFGNQTSAGTYSVLATDAITNCTSVMSVTPTVSINPVPSVYPVIGGGSFCLGDTGVHVGLGNSQSGIRYELFNGSTTTGELLTGTGASLDFGRQLVAGTYTVSATDLGTLCNSNMSGSVSVTVNPLPAVYTVSGSGQYCAGGIGIDISLSNSDAGFTYQLYNGASTVGGGLAGVTGSLDFGLQLAGGVYTVTAKDNITGCVSNMSSFGSVTVNPLPVVYTVTGGGGYCSDAAGTHIGLDSANSGILYQLYYGSGLAGSPVLGADAPLDFGLQSATGIYTVLATNPTTSCLSNMSGSAIVTINLVPAVFNVSGGGAYCYGTGGMHITLDNSTTGVNYQLYSGTATVGSPFAGNTSNPIDFGAQTGAGVYTVVAVDGTTSCSSNMAGSASITVNPLPAVFNVTGGGSYCTGATGVNVGLDGSEFNINYDLYHGATAVNTGNPGSGGAIDFGVQTGAGIYTVLATNPLTTCTNVMTDSAKIVINPLPAVYTVSGGGSYCYGGAGFDITLSLSEVGVNYQLYNGTSTSGGSVAGTGSLLDFGMQTASGVYTVLATNSASLCASNMSGSGSVTLNPLPAVHTITGGGGYCMGDAGVHIGLDNSDPGVKYMLYNAATLEATVAGTGLAIDFGNQTDSGNYIVVATDSITTCASNMSGISTVSVNPLPVAFTVSGSGTSYCAGGSGIDITQNNSTIGVNYQLYNGPVTSGIPVAGTGGPLDFGLRTLEGTYIVVATDAVTTCSNLMTGAPPVHINALPQIYTVTGGGGYCPGGVGVNVGLSNSDLHIRYQLHHGSTPVGALVSGTGGALDFGLQTSTGAYIVVATDSASGCPNTMTGTANVSLDSLPRVHAVSGGGSYCSGGVGVHIGMAASDTGIYYQLYQGAAALGSAVAGSGSTIDFGLYTPAGVYTVVATSAATACTSNMSDSAKIVIDTLPGIYVMTGGGSYCMGSAGVPIGLNGSENGVNYQLIQGASSVTSLPGTGAALAFGIDTATGSYSVIATNATTGCSSTMSGSVLVSVNALPVVHLVTGGGSYCAGGAGVHIGLDTSNTGVYYQLYNGAVAIDTAMPGNGGALDFGWQNVAGAYTVAAVNAITTCTSNMADSAVVVITPLVTPGVSIVSSMGNMLCEGTSTTFTATPVNGGSAPVYQWAVNSVVVVTGGSTYSYIPSNGDTVSLVMMSSAACPMPVTVNASDTITVIANVTPAVSVSATPGGIVCPGTEVIFSPLPVNGGTAPAFVWRRNGVDVGTGASYNYIPVNGDVISCRMTSNYACRLVDTVSSAGVDMSVYLPLSPSVAITAIPGTTIVQGQTDTLKATVTNGGTAPTYQWYVNGLAITGATSSVYFSSNFANNDSVSCVVMSSGACGGQLSFNTVTIDVTNVGVMQVSEGAMDVRVVPNPNKGQFIIKGSLTSAQDEDVTVEVTDMIGQVVYKEHIVATGGKIDQHVSLGNSISSGMYILNIHSGNESKVFHVMIEQ